MKYLVGAVFAVAMLSGGCASTSSQISEKDILGVWELSRALNLNPQDAGFVENIKLIFQPEGKMYKMGPQQNEFAEHKRYGYRIEGDTLVTTRPDKPDVTRPFSIHENTLVITEEDGAKVHFERRSTDYTKIPVWEPRLVPFTVDEGS